MNTPLKIALLGSGSWATALAKIIHTNVPQLNWYIREKEIRESLHKHSRNSLYLSNVKFNTEVLHITENADDAVKDADIVIFCVPSKFVESLAESITVDLSGKKIITAVKGIVPSNNTLVSEFIHRNFSVPTEHIAVISGPCHAEEVALERLSYLTIGALNTDFAQEITSLLSVYYIKTHISQDIIGIEYAAVLKNIMALATGISHGLGYGDNFTSVLISNAVQEMNHFLTEINKTKRDINESVYLGDLLVTAYSQFSRNRTFGMMIGKGYSVNTAELEMNMIAEGYYGVNCIMQINQEINADLPITQAVYNTLYERISASMEFKILAESFR
ncbi:MAG: NAD(P)-binding domain-containing protein [Bacteroidales bacterium]|jgi:glycerol-3-phosphate dehydrogenase (NAD(P)+)|nr:NAD(P)-binding domain-containing protein [Bacteroidales bacterium]